MQWHLQVPDDRVRMTVRCGWITLEGEVVLKGMVRSFAERRDAERAPWNAPGVTKVDDRLIVGA